MRSAFVHPQATRPHLPYGNTHRRIHLHQQALLQQVYSRPMLLAKRIHRTRRNRKTGIGGRQRSFGSLSSISRRWREGSSRQRGAGRGVVGHRPRSTVARQSHSMAQTDCSLTGCSSASCAVSRFAGSITTRALMKSLAAYRESVSGTQVEVIIRLPSSLTSPQYLS